LAAAQSGDLMVKRLCSRGGVSRWIRGLCMVFALCICAREMRAQDLLLVPRYLDRGLELKRSGDLEGAMRSFRLALAADSTYARAWFELGYLLNQSSRRGEAVSAFEAGLRHEPRNIFSWRQLGYWYGDEGRLQDAAKAFETAIARGSENPFDVLEIGFLKQRIGDRVGALAAFNTSKASTDTAVVRLARQSIETMTAQLAPNAATSAAQGVASTSGSNGWGRPVFMDLYATPLYQTRFNNAILQLVSRAGVVAEERFRFSPYVSLRLTRDARSRGGIQPVLFSDNVAIPAVGARLQPLKPWGADNLYLYGEVGEAVDLVTAGQRARRRFDYRVGGFYIGQWRAGSADPSDHTPLIFISDVYSDAGYYSRVENAIGSAQLRESLRVYESGGHGFDLFTRMSVLGDTRKVYYNNAMEASAGITLYPEPRKQVVVILERLNGYYLMRPPTGTPWRYSDARITVILSAYRWIAARKP
jgi:tetratricopeptide (TPR) repeat protein